MATNLFFWNYVLSCLNTIVVLLCLFVGIHSTWHVCKRMDNGMHKRVNLTTNTILMIAGVVTFCNHVMFTYVYPHWKQQVYFYTRNLFITASVVYLISLYAVLSTFVYRLYSTFTDSIYEYSTKIFMFLAFTLAASALIGVFPLVTYTLEVDFIDNNWKYSDFKDDQFIMAMLFVSGIIYVFDELLVLCLFIKPLWKV